MLTRIILSGETPATSCLNKISEVSLVRSEYILRSLDAYDPSVFRKKIVDYLLTLSEQLSAPIWFRLEETEARDRYVLGIEHESWIPEDNPILGYRGVAEYLNDPLLLEPQISAIRTVCSLNNNEYGLVIPYIRDASELWEVVRLISPLPKNLRLGIMVETPAAVLLLDEICNAFPTLSRVILGLNDLTTLILGQSRQSHYFRYDHPALLEAISMAQNCAFRNQVDLILAGNFSPKEAWSISTHCSIPIENFAFHYAEWARTNELCQSTDPSLFVAQINRINSDKRLVEAGLMNECNIARVAGMAI